MATMLSGAAIMDAALLLIAADEECPQPQTEEHLIALNVIGIKNIIIVQNKIDSVSKEQALKNYEEIKKLVKGTVAEDAPIIPISAKYDLNIDFLIKTIVEKFKVPKRDLTKDPIMLIARSFDINKPGTEIKNLIGGIIGGSIKCGKLKVGEEIEIKPGIKKGSRWETVKTKIVDIKTGGKSVKEAVAGGNLAILTSLDPFISKSDNLAGGLLGKKLPDIKNEVKLKIKLLDKLVGTKDHEKIDPIRKNEPLMINVNSSISLGIVRELSKEEISLELRRPVCATLEDRFSISRMIKNRWRLIGFGNLKN